MTAGSGFRDYCFNLLARRLLGALGRSVYKVGIQSDIVLMRPSPAPKSEGEAGLVCIIALFIIQWGREGFRLQRLRSQARRQYVVAAVVVVLVVLVFSPER